MGQYGYNNGDFGWTQLDTTDPNQAIDFYSALIGWEKRPGPTPDYHVVARGEEMLGGITKLQDGETAPRWMPYITVTDLDAALAKTSQLGGTIVAPASPLPDGGRMAIIKDPQGAITGLAQYAKKS